MLGGRMSEIAEPALCALLKEIGRAPDGLAASDLDQMLRSHPMPHGGLYSKKAILHAYDMLARQGSHLPCAREHLVHALRISPTRTHSGVTPVTVFTKPHPCPGTCIFCPSDVRMPKSYTLGERGSHEGARHSFDPYRQTLARLVAYRAAGQPTDKIELLILGGTWSSYPRAYQRWFVLRCFEALNAFSGSTSISSRVDANETGRALPSFKVTYGDSAAFSQEEGRGRYNLQLRQLGSDSSEGGASWHELEAAQRTNESASARCVGLVLETRPDHITADELVRLRRLGATKIQLGVQSIRDEILTANRRGHDVQSTRRAFSMLRGAGFKVLTHWMPNLLGSSPDADIEEYAQLFSEPAYRPDELKIYPCVLDPTAELMDEAEAGRWRAYAPDELDRVLEAALLLTPRYCRLARVMRDLPGPDASPSGKRASRRHELEKRLRNRGALLRDIRARELGARAPEGEVKLCTLEYDTSSGREVFFEWIDVGDHIAGFLRLFLPREAPFIAELEGSALLRELHVYGRASRLGMRDRDSAQHRGLGAALIEAALTRTTRAGFKNLSVISSVGTREYYRRHGFEDGDLYQHRS